MIKLLFSLFFFCASFAPNQTDNLDDIGTSLKNGSAKELIRYCSDPVNLKLEDINQSFSKADAEAKLRKFFQEHPPTNFSFVHRGKSENEGVKYSIGQYFEQNGRFRVVLVLKDNPSGYEIGAIRFTKEK